MNDPMSVVLCLPPERTWTDPGPDDTHKRDVQLVASWDDDTKGVAGWSSAGWEALALAASSPQLERLVLVSLPYPDDGPNNEDREWPVTADAIDAIGAKTLLLYGSADDATGSSHGTRWQKRLPNARLEMVPGGGHDILELVWKRTLSFLAPRRTRRD